MNRRRVLGALTGTLLAATTPSRAERAGAFRRVGWLHLGQAWQLADFRGRMRELGWIEGMNYSIEARWADNDLKRLPALAAELVAMHLDVIVTQSTLAAVAASRATRTTPIVMAGSSNPIAEGLVESLSRPGHNVTGVLNNPGPAFAVKLIQLLCTAAPRATRIAVLERAVDGNTRSLVAFVDPRITFTIAEADSHATVPDALVAALGRGANAVFVPPTAVNSNADTFIAEFARAHRWPSIGGSKQFVALGGLMSYWASWREIRRQAADYADKILRGSKPGDLPVEIPGKFELVINLKTARELDLAIPQSLRLRADELIF